MKQHVLALLLTGAAAAFSTADAAGLRIGLQEDLDQIDPATGGAFVDRIVFTALCDKLVDIDQRLGYVPQLATEWRWAADTPALTIKIRPGVVFHDGEKLDAAAVKFNVDRYKTLPESRRKAELAPVTSVDVVDPLTVRFNLSQPYAPLLGVLSDRAGMMVSPKAAAEMGSRFPNEAVTITQRNQKGDYEASINIWSGRPDPDGNISIWHACNGFLNWGKYCDPKLDDLLRRAKATTIADERYALYRQAMETLLAARPHIVLYHYKWHWAASAKLGGFVPYPDGLIRLRGVTMD